MKYDCTKKYDLSDVTFLIPLRIDSIARKNNLDILISLLCRDFIANIIILEADIKRLYYYDLNTNNIEYHFIVDTNPIFHRTKYINKLLDLAKTKFVGIWDTDAIVFPDQIFTSIKILRSTQNVMVFPYDGRFYRLDRSLTNLFGELKDFTLLQNIAGGLPLMFGYHSVGGAFFVKKKIYIEAGGENENFYGWGPEDLERVKRLEILNFPIHRVHGKMFHLWHPIFSQAANYKKENEIKKKNIIALIKTCSCYNNHNNEEK